MADAPAESLERLYERVREITGYELYDIQKEVLKRLNELFEDKVRKESGKLRGIIAMPTGTGKTMVALTFLLHLFLKGELKEGDKVLWLAPRNILLDQAEGEGGLLLGDLKDVWIAQAEPRWIWKTKDSRLQAFLHDEKIRIIPVTPQLLNNLQNKKYRHYASELTRVRGVILDEVHHTYWGPEIKESIQPILNRLGNIRFILGLSATPTKEAKDALEKIIYSFSTRKAMDMGILIKCLRIYWTRTEIDRNSIRFEDQFSELISGRDEWQVAIYERTKKYAEKIIDVLKNEVGEDSLERRIPKTLIVAANTTEAEVIGRVLDEEVEKLRGRKDLVFVVHYKKKCVKETFSRFKEEKEGILVTVDMAKMGFDDKNLEVLVIARPVDTPLGYVQIRGRVLRRPNEKAAEDSIKLLGSKPHAVLIDFTEASRHEYTAEQIEKGEYLVKTSEARRDLKGYGEAPLAHGEVKVGDFNFLEIEGTKETKISKVEEVREKPIPVAKEREEQASKPQCPFCHSVGTLKHVSTFRSSSKHSKLEAKCTRCGQYFRVVARRTIGLQWEIVSIKPIFRER